MGSSATYHPVMLVKVLLYGYTIGVRSSRKMARLLERDVAFRYLAANQQPDFRTISDLRKTHRAAFEELFGEVLLLCREPGWRAQSADRRARAAPPHPSRNPHP